MHENLKEKLDSLKNLEREGVISEAEYKDAARALVGLGPVPKVKGIGDDPLYQKNEYTADAPLADVKPAPVVERKTVVEGK